MFNRKDGTMLTKVFLLIGILFMVSPNQIFAATVTVKQLGGGDYTTISAAINNAQQDDTIMVYPGRYEEAVVINKDLTLIGSGPQVTTIYSSIDGIEIKSNINATILGFSITSAKTGIFIRSTSVFPIIRNNIIVGNGDKGIFIACGSKATITNNVICYNGSTGISTDTYWNCSNAANIHNNIVSNNGGYGLYLYKANQVISYNNVFSNTLGNYSQSAPGTGDISLSPQFVDPFNGNFVLQSTSPCIDTGRPGSADVDPDGTRNDMGAYGGADAAAFWPYPPGAPIITNLNATPTSVPQGAPITINATGEIQ